MALLNSPVPAPESLKDVLLNKEYTVEVDTSAAQDGSSFKKLYGMKSLEFPFDSDMIDITTYDDGKFKSEMPGDTSWGLTATVLLALYKQGASKVEDPALVALKEAHEEQQTIRVRWYRRNDAIGYGYEGFAYAKVAEQGGPKSQPTEATVTLSGVGERYKIVSPFVAAPPTPAAWTADTEYQFGDLATVAGGTLRVTEDGTSGATPPTAPATVGGTVIDGTVEWTRTV